MLSNRAKMRVTLLAVAVGLVLADSSIVVLALPEIYRLFDTTIVGVSWVLVSFNLALAVFAVPGGRWARRYGPGRIAGFGLAVFAGASFACALAGGLGGLIAARAVQGLGGALAITAALELLTASLGSDRRAIPVWVGAGALGAAVGPAVGGLLTEFVSWQSIFLFQVPLALLAATPLVGVAIRESGLMTAVIPKPEERPHIGANVALALTSAGIAATLFLVVVMLIEGWRLTPVAAAIVVTTVPLSTLAGARISPRIPDLRVRAASGAILLAGGLAGLGLLPGALVVLTIPPQILAGFGLAFVLSALTEAAVSGKQDGPLHAGWTIASRHAGIVIGLVLLTPVFSASLESQREQALDAGTAILLDSDLPTSTKLEFAQRIPEEVATSDADSDQIPRIGSAFEPLPDDEQERQTVLRLRDGLIDQIDRAATSAFSGPFLIAALLALVALIPIVGVRRLEL